MTTSGKRRPVDADRTSAATPDSAMRPQSRRLVRAPRIPRDDAEAIPQQRTTTATAPKKYPAGYFYG
jgi:hypothetical protein